MQKRRTTTNGHPFSKHEKIIQENHVFVLRGLLQL